jgi:heat-inducible transcriptional repressor
MKQFSHQSLTERQLDVLATIVRLYVSSAHPVSSRQLAKTMAQRLSPATLRNTMADLEEMGFLAQPHTSAGRVPTELAYRLYVDRMVDRSELRLTPGEQTNFRQHLDQEASPGELLQQATSLLSEETGCAAIVTLPELSRTVCKHIEFVHLHGRSVLAILVADSGLVQQRVVQTEKDVNQDELHRMSAFVNEHFTNLSLVAVRERIVEMMREERQLYDTLLRDALELASRALEGESLASPDLRFEATSRMLGQPEFASGERMREIYRAFEQKSRLLQLLSACIEEHASSVIVMIGSELNMPDIKELTLITSSYKYGGRSLGSLGVLGPMRMDYPKIAAWVGFAGQTLSQIISGKEDGSLER